MVTKQHGSSRVRVYINHILYGFYIFVKPWHVHIVMKRRCTKEIEVACNFVKVHTSRDSENVPTKMYSPIWKDADG